MNTTIEYYNKNAKEYAQATRSIDMQAVYDHFEKYLLPNSYILDVGCGSGRDAKHFRELGHTLLGIDPSSELCKEAEQFADIKVINLSVEEMDYIERFDAVWACASLLHVKKEHLDIALHKIAASLVNEGILYTSWKSGKGERIENGKYYQDFLPETIREVINKTDLFDVLEIWESKEERNGNHIKWTNAIVRKK